MTSFLKPGNPEHYIDELRSPVAVVLRCTCGWHRTITRRQNALARAAKIQAAIREHEREVQKKPESART